MHPRMPLQFGGVVRVSFHFSSLHGSLFIRLEAGYSVGSCCNGYAQQIVGQRVVFTDALC